MNIKSECTVKTPVHSLNICFLRPVHDLNSLHSTFEKGSWNPSMRYVQKCIHIYFVVSVHYWWFKGGRLRFQRVVSFCLLDWICNFFNHQHHVSGHSLLNPLCTHSASEEVRVTWLSGASNLYDFVVFFCLFGVTRSKSKRSKLCCKKTNMSFMKNLYPNIWPPFWYNNGRTEWLRDVCPAQLPVLF